MDVINNEAVVAEIAGPAATASEDAAAELDLRGELEAIALRALSDMADGERVEFTYGRDRYVAWSRDGGLYIENRGH